MEKHAEQEEVWAIRPIQKIKYVHAV